FCQYTSFLTSDCSLVQPSSHHLDLHSFPTRRSSDLGYDVDGTDQTSLGQFSGRVQQTYKHSVPRFFVPEHGTMFTGLSNTTRKLDRKSGSAGMPRPISYAVFCLKKKKQITQTTHPDS